MRINPKGDWTIDDVEQVCRRFGLTCSAPKRGDHYKVSHPTIQEILTIPAHRPIRPVYIRRLVVMIDMVEGDEP